MKSKLISIFLILSATSIFAQDSVQTFLSLRNTGVAEFQSKYPEYDGRGTIVFVLDTGVDMGVDGLTKTSTGETKVIDVQDFTSQGDTPFYEAEIDEEDDVYYFLNEDKNLKVKGANKLSSKANDDKYFIGLVKESLWKNSGSGASDVNGNGTEEDNFYFVTFSTSENGETFWVVYFDTDSDGDLSDEKPLRNYKENFDAFTIPNKNGLPRFTMALNIFPEEKLVKFFFDDGSHGTHCAGISAGNMIGNSELYGVAPGANVIGLKLGNNNLAGGATVAESMKNAYLYADKLSKEIEKPCIINMSFGVGSEIEGKADMELFLDDLVKDNPYLYIATSNGNDGPGISTAGMPATSNSVFSTGAVLAKEVGNDLYGTTLDKDIILHFSSRGGEVSKPDVVAPGACVSTVPNFSGGDRFWGTSMASPYSAGVMSVLMGAMKVEYPDLKIPSLLLYKVLRESATPMDGYDFVDQGSGLINIQNAYDLLKKYIDSGEIKNFETYSITSTAPNQPGGRSDNLYLRDASFLTQSEDFYFKVSRNNVIDNDKFYRIFNLKSSAEWLQPVQKKIHLRNDNSTYVKVKIDKSILDTAGLYNAKICATRADKSKMKEFEMMATIVVPYILEESNHYSISFENEKIAPGMLKRYFLKVPAGATAMDLTISSDKKEFTALRYYLHNQDGREILFSTIGSEFEEGSKTNIVKDINPGVYELVVLGQFTTDYESIYDLDVKLNGINVLGHGIVDDKVTVANYTNNVESYNVSSSLLGYSKNYTAEMKGEKTFEIPFELKKGESKKVFEVEISKEVFNKVTDFALMIYDESGKAKDVGGLAYNSGEASISKSSSNDVEKYKFVMIPGFANAPSAINIKICEKTFYDNATDINVNSSRITMYPDINYELKCDYDSSGLEKPEDTSFFGNLNFKSSKDESKEFTFEIKVQN